MGVALDTGEIEVEPRLSSILSGVYSSGEGSIISGSPAKDAGTDLGSSFNTDFLEVIRPQSSAWDIGAYEYVA